MASGVDTGIISPKIKEPLRPKDVEYTDIESMYHVGALLASLPTMNRYWALQNLEEEEKVWKDRVKLKKTKKGETRHLTSELWRIEYKASSMLEVMGPAEKWEKFLKDYADAVSNYCFSVINYEWRQDIAWHIKATVYIWWLNTKAQEKGTNLLMGASSYVHIG